MFLRVLKVFDPHYSLEEIMDFKGKEEHPQLYWFIALTLLFYIDEMGIFSASVKIYD